MKLDLALKIAKQILEQTNICELKFSSADDPMYDTNIFEYDLQVLDSSVSDVDMRMLDAIVAKFENVELLVDLYHDMIRIYERELEEEGQAEEKEA